ncbi:MAG TPA: hypothetical protein VGM71_16530, partial [Luteibacter sp.]
ALPADRKTTDPEGVRWWKVDISAQGGTLEVWVADQGMAGVSWQSPQAWPGFQLVDGATFSLLEAFQRHAVITGLVRPDDEQSFTATTNALAHSDLIVALERAIDESAEKNGHIHGRDIAAARTKPLLAHALSRMIVRFESHWSPHEERWAALDDLMNHDWKGERERQNKRGWWNEVASKIDTFPQDPQVHHIHPFGWIDNFISAHVTGKPEALVKSGSHWHPCFPTSTSLDDLISPFRENVKDFVAVLEEGGAKVSVAATLRPPERAYLMHYAHKVAGGFDPSDVPLREGVKIDWAHEDSNGNVDLAASRSAAQDMVRIYAIRYPPSLTSRHTEGRAIDMSISNYVGRSFRKKNGEAAIIPDQNALAELGDSYGVIKLRTDPPHWSDDGR